MEKLIFKYELQVTGRQVLSLPMGSEILTVQVQRGVPQLWALVDPSGNLVPTTIKMFGTGNPIDCNLEVDGYYISTIQLNGGDLVFHVFETCD